MNKIKMIATKNFALATKKIYTGDIFEVNQNHKILFTTKNFAVEYTEQDKEKVVVEKKELKGYNNKMISADETLTKEKSKPKARQKRKPKNVEKNG